MTSGFYRWENFKIQLSELIEWTLHTVEMWCDRLGLSVCPDKNGLVAFMRRRKLSGFFKPCLFGTILCCSMSVKYLGVVLDSQLTWRKHMVVKVQKALNLWVCRRAYGVMWGMRPRVVHYLYVSIIRPSVTFASLVWWPGCRVASAKKKKLSWVKRLACLGIMEVIPTSPTNPVETLFFLPPLD
jgi:hypothetical protein